jgi:hypothetical protein
MVWAVACDCQWCCCVQEGGLTSLVVACLKRDKEIAKMLLAIPGVDVNATTVVSCVWGFRPPLRLLRA